MTSSSGISHTNNQHHNRSNGVGSSSSHDGGYKTSSDSTGAAGFKVYGSVFKVDARYEFLNPLGKGSYGVVCAAKDQETGQRMAIKKVCPMAKRSVDAKHTLREVLLLQLLGKHPNVISVHNLSTNLRDDELYIVMDLMDTDLHRVIQSSQALSDSHVKYFLHQILRGVKYLHDNGVLHRDLKPGNLLLTKTCQLKIADFGLARKSLRSSSSSSFITSGVLSGSERPRSAPSISSSSSSSATRGSIQDRGPMTEHVVTRWYRAPELMLQPDGFYGESVDMWSIGCIFAEILGRKALFPGKNFLHQLTLIFDVIGTPPSEATAKIKSSQAQRFLKSLGKKPKVPFRTLFPHASDEAVDLLERLLEFDPEKRLSAQDALAHPYMQPIERKYKGVDPYPSARVDFSFETKKLTKMDLRALIIKEVDTFRRSVAHTAAIDAELSVETTLSGLSSSLPAATMAAPSSAAAAVRVNAPQVSERDKKRPASASAASHATPSTATGALVGGGNSRNSGRVMCGSAGISMIHSGMRQRLMADQADGTHGQGGEGGVAAASSTQHGFVSSSTSNGNSSTTRKPVNPVSVGIGSNQPRIRMVSKPPVPKQPPMSSGWNGGLPGAESQGHVRVVESRSFLASSGEDESEELTQMEQQQQPDKEKPRQKSPDTIPLVAKPLDPVKAAFSALEQRSRTLMANDATNASPMVAPHWAAPATATLHRSKAVVAETMRPETSQSASSLAKSPALSSSTSSSDNDSDDERRRMGMTPQLPWQQQSQRGGGGGGNLTARAGASGEPATIVPTLPRRRVASAGPLRAKPTPVPVGVAGAGGLSAAIAQKHAPFVGSATSLIRAQRSNNGQSLADSADQMVATLASAKGELRDESTGGSVLKHQRSTTQLNQQQSDGKKLVGRKKATVPKSPKFSVMSWQKKKEMGATRTLAIDPVTGAVVPGGGTTAGHVVARR